MMQMITVFKHTVCLEGTALSDAAAAAVMRSRLTVSLMRFAERPDRLVEGLACRRISRSERDDGAVFYEREIAAGNVVFSDTVTVTEGEAIFNVSPTDGIPASRFTISLSGGLNSDFEMCFRYEEDARVTLPENIRTLREKAWVAKDRDLARWCAKLAGF